MISGSFTTNRRFENAIAAYRRETAEKLIDDSQRMQWPDRHLMGLHGQPVPFHMAQNIAHDSTARIVAMIAGSQSGKTSYLPWWLAQEIERTASPEGNNDYIVCTSSYDLFKLKLLPAVLQVFEEILGNGRFWAGDKIIELCNPETGLFEAKKSTDKMWGRIILRSANALGGLESATARAACLDEAGQDEFTLKAYQAIERRLRLFRGRQLFTTTLYNLGWVKSQIIDIALKGGKQYTHKIGDAELIHTTNDGIGIELIQYDSILNPEFSIEEFLHAQSTMAKDEFKMFYKGQVAKLRAMIYDCLDTNIHVIPHFDIPREWPKGLLGIDPVGMMTAVVWLAFDPEREQLHVYREYEEPFGKTTQGHVNEILKASLVDREILKVIGGGPGERQARVDWTGAGLPVQECPITEVWSQIRRVYALIKENGLLIHDTCPRLIADMGTMKRKEDRHGNLTDQIEDKDTWHLPDALRYIIGWLSSAGSEFEEIVYNRIRI